MECVGAYGMETTEGPDPVNHLLQKLLDAGCQLLGGEWLRDVIVTATLEALFPCLR